LNRFRLLVRNVQPRLWKFVQVLNQQRGHSHRGFQDQSHRSIQVNRESFQVNASLTFIFTFFSLQGKEERALLLAKYFIVDGVPLAETSGQGTAPVFTPNTLDLGDIVK